jgi:alkylation response protein AidB-like acyl-CoA dehydrogenase
MELLLDESQSLLRDAAARICADKGGPRRARVLRNAEIEHDAQCWDEIVKAGWIATMVAEEHGGLGLGALDLALVAEEAGRQMLMTPLVESAAAAWALSRAAAGRPAPPDLCSLLDGSRIVIAAVQSRDWRYDGASAPDALLFDQRRLSLTGTLANVPFAGIADSLLTEASVSGGEPLMVVVPRESAGLSLATTRNVDGSTASSVAFADVAIPADAILARGSNALVLLDQLRELMLLLTAAELLGLAEAALDMTTDYLKLRRQFGRPIGSFQALQHRLVNCHVDIELSRSLIYRLLTAWDAGTCHPAMISGAKARISRGALDTVRTALQLHGAIGYTDEHDIGLYYKRAVALAAKYGNEINHVNRFSALTWAADATPAEDCA